LPCGMPIALVLLMLTRVFVIDAGAASPLTISLKEEAAVATAAVLLKDVAVLYGPDKHELDVLAQMKIADSPVFGETAILSRNRIRELVRAAAGPLAAGAMSGALAVRVRLQCRPVTEDDVRPLLRARILEATPWKESEIEIRSIGNLKGIEIPTNGSEIRVSAEGEVFGAKSMMAPLEIIQEGKILRSYWITAEINIRAEVLAATRKISSGMAIAPDDIEKKTAEIPDMRGSYARDPEEAVGKVSRRSIFPGGFLTRDAFANPFLVKSGETVRLHLARNGITLISLAKAEQNGQLGQVIRVRSLEFAAFLKAQVTGRSEVWMQ
jgi:flagella basal body P-ring formation protein FlgA